MYEDKGVHVLEAKGNEIFLGKETNHLYTAVRESHVKTEEWQVGIIGIIGIIGNLGRAVLEDCWG